MIATPRPIPAQPALWRPCPTCWAQRRILEDRNGEGSVPQRCPTCLGQGEQLVARA